MDTMGSEASTAGSHDFPFLNDDKTTEYLGGSKTLFLLRGLPGSGKSTLADAICKKYPGKAVVCSAQSHLAREEKPPYSKETLEEAHAACQEAVQKYCKDGFPIVIVDNTNLALWEIQKYSAIGQRFDYVELLVETKTPWCANADQLVQKTTRGFTIEAMRKKLEKLEAPLYPLFYGWYVNEPDSRRLRALGETFYDRCLSKGQFRDEFVKHLIHDPSCEKPDPHHYFSSENYIVGPLLLHCTAFFSNHGEVTQSTAYAAREAVKADNGKAFTVDVIGLLITPRSLGLRLKLGKKELPLWLEDATIDEGEAGGNGATEACLGRDPDGETPDDACIITPLSPTCGTGSRAHFSLGSGPGVEPVQTGLDLVQIVKREQESVRLKGKGFTCIGLDGGMACGYGEGNWMVCFDDPCPVDVLFSSYY